MSETSRNEHRPGGCSETDRVLSTFLDGESIAELDYLALEAVREHRDACAVCRRALDAARRLDAEVAQSSPHELEQGRADELLDAMFAVVDAEDREAADSPNFAGLEPVPATGSSRSLLVAVAAGVILGGLATWFAIGEGSRDAGVRPAAPEHLAQDSVVPTEGGQVPLIADGRWNRDRPVGCDRRAIGRGRHECFDRIRPG